jgi:hypothetical protein
MVIDKSVGNCKDDIQPDTPTRNVEIIDETLKNLKKIMRERLNDLTILNNDSIIIIKRSKIDGANTIIESITSIIEKVKTEIETTSTDNIIEEDIDKIIQSLQQIDKNSSNQNDLSLPYLRRCIKPLQDLKRLKQKSKSIVLIQLANMAIILLTSLYKKRKEYYESRRKEYYESRRKEYYEGMMKEYYEGMMKATDYALINADIFANDIKKATTSNNLNEFRNKIEQLKEFRKKIKQLNKFREKIEPILKNDNESKQEELLENLNKLLVLFVELLELVEKVSVVDTDTKGGNKTKRKYHQNIKNKNKSKKLVVKSIKRRIRRRRTKKKISNELYPKKM